MSRTIFEMLSGRFKNASTQILNRRPLSETTRVHLPISESRIGTMTADSTARRWFIGVVVCWTLPSARPMLA